MVPARSRCPAWSPEWKKRIAATPKCRGRELLGPSIKLAGEGLLVDWWTTLMIASCGRRSAALSGERGRLSPGRPAAERAMGHPLRRAAAAGQAQGDAGASGRAARAISIKAIWPAASPPMSGEPAARFGRGPCFLPRLSARAAGDPLSRRHGLRDAGTDLRTDTGACVAPAAAGSAARGGEPELGLHRLCACAAIGLSRTAEGHGRCRRPARARRRALAPSCTTHFSMVDRDGNMAAVTQTLLSTFGSKYVLPQSGITMNNGIMWFDPMPGDRIRWRRENAA